MHKEMPWGVVPIKIEELDFWFPQADLGSIGNAVAWTDTLEARRFNTHAKLMGRSGNLIMDLKSLRCVAYEATVPPIISSLKPRQPYMQSSWMPDISTLSPSQLAEHCDSPVVINSVCKVVELLDRKYGVVSVILLDRPSQSDLDMILQGLSATASIAIGYAKPEHMEFHESSDEADSQISSFLIPEDSTDWATLSLSTPDLVIIHEDMIQAGTHPEFFKILKGITGERGRMVLSGTQVRCNELAISLSSHGWSVATLHLSSRNDVLLCDTTPCTNGTSDRSQNLTVLCADGDARLSNELLDALKASRLNVDVELIQDFNASTDERIVLPIEHTRSFSIGKTAHSKHLKPFYVLLYPYYGLSKV